MRIATGVAADVVEGGLDGGDHLRGRPARQEHRVGGRDEVRGARHRLPQEGPQVDRPADGGLELFDRHAADKGAQPLLLLPRHRPEPCRLTTGVHTTAVDERKRLEHAVVNDPGQPIPLDVLGLLFQSPTQRRLLRPAKTSGGYVANVTRARSSSTASGHVGDPRGEDTSAGTGEVFSAAPSVAVPLAACVQTQIRV